MDPHSCVVKTDSTIQCWGGNYGGSLGNASVGLESAVPVTVTGFSGATQVSSGMGGTCAIRDNGLAYCWGYNDRGQLGNPAAGSSSVTPVQVVGLSNVTDISIGWDTACAVANGGKLYCWGGGSSPEPTEIAVSGVESVSVGLVSVCIVFTDGRVACAGNNDMGQLGDGTQNSSETFVDVVGITDARSVAVGYFHACAALDSGAVKCWGAYTPEGQPGFGLLGDGSGRGSLTPVTVTGIDTATDVALNIYGGCARLAGGAVKCWGYRFLGGLDDPQPSDFNAEPVAMPGLDDVVDLIDGGYMTHCAVRAGGTAVCWGFNFAGSLGNGFGSWSPDPAGTVLTGATDLSAGGGRHACAIRSDFKVACWGDNGYGQAGVDKDEQRSLYAPLAVDTAGQFTSVSAGYQHTCALKDDGTVWCWGEGHYGQLGNGANSESHVPVQATGITNATAVLAGQTFSCAILADESLSCWGSVAWTNNNVPTAVSGISGVQAVAGSRNICAIVSGGGVKCWGSDSGGMLGNGTWDSSATPVDVTGISGATALTVGEQNACASTAASTYCWGSGTFGRLGNGLTSSSNTPVEVGPPTLASASVAAGPEHTCAASVPGNVFCWGNGDSAQTGDVAMGQNLTPHEVNGLSGATKVASGAEFSCALLAGGTVRCWGASSDGALGDGIGRMVTATPTAVVGLADILVGEADTSEPETDDTDGVPAPGGTTTQVPIGKKTPPAVLAPKPRPKLHLSGRTLVFSNYALRSSGKKGRKGCPPRLTVTVTVPGVSKRHVVKLKPRWSGGKCLVSAKVRLPTKAGKAKSVTVKLSGKAVVKRTVTVKRAIS